MNRTDELDSIVVLIDADNAQVSKLKAILDEISTYGRIIVKKAFGNWNDDNLKNWESALKRLAIKPEQQFAYTRGKNATDISLTIGAMDLLSTGIYDAFVLVSSDSDYTPLAIRLRESGVAVLGVGEKKTPEPFRNACDDFILTEDLGHTAQPVTKETPAKEAPAAPVEKPVDENTIMYIYDLLTTIGTKDKYQDADGWVNISTAGTYIKRVKPDFNVRSYGYEKMPDLVKGAPNLFEHKKYPGKGTVNIFAYKVKEASR